MRLRELQAGLRALIADPATLDGPSSLIAGRVAALSIRGDDRLSAADRVRIYARMHALRLRDALEHDYPALHRALGDDGFAALVQRYVAAHPSDRPSLRDLGRHLPGFLQRSVEQGQAWLAELAQLEWAMVEAFDAPDEPSLDRAHLGSLQADEWPALSIEPVRSLQLLSLTTPADTIRDGLLTDAGDREPAPTPTLLRVWRQDLVVYVRRTPELEMATLRRLHRGATFAALCEWLADADSSDDDAAATAAGLLRRWVDDGLLARP
mgnify:CR=1 FL=1